LQFCRLGLEPRSRVADTRHPGATQGERITHSLEWSRLEPLWDQCWALMAAGKIRADFLLNYGSLDR
jgi:hypothetical protein